MDKNIVYALSYEYAKDYPNDPKMHKFCMSRVSDAVLLESGIIFIFEKPAIAKDFCFGYRLSSVDNDEHDAAEGMASFVRNDGGAYFKAYNLRDFDRINDELNEATVRHIDCFVQSRGCGKANICDCFHDVLHYIGRWGKLPDNSVLLTAADIENLKKVNASEKLKFEKRLNTYLKKYGTSKLRSWTYWKDE